MIIALSLDSVLGLHVKPEDMTLLQMSSRALVALPLALAFLRLGMRRSMDRASAFDVLTGVVLGSVLSRAINGQAAYFPTVGVTAVIVAFHAALAHLGARWHAFSLLTKGRPVRVLAQGAPDVGRLRLHGFTESDLHEALRLHANVDDPSEAESAWIERNGEISVVKSREKGV